MKLIVGLGNPGTEHEKTRHNIGMICLDYVLAEELKKLDFSDFQENKKFHALVAEGQINGEKIILAKPMTFMNNSGQAVQALAGYYKIETKDVVIIHDDLDFELGRVEVQTNRSAAGHNGVKSVIEQMGTQEFTRIRVGVAKKMNQRQGETKSFVLSKFGLMERRKLAMVKKLVAEAVLKILEK